MNGFKIGVLVVILASFIAILCLWLNNQDQKLYLGNVENELEQLNKKYIELNADHEKTLRLVEKRNIKIQEVTEAILIKDKLISDLNLEKVELQSTISLLDTQLFLTRNQLLQMESKDTTNAFNILKNELETIVEERKVLVASLTRKDSLILAYRRGQSLFLKEQFKFKQDSLANWHSIDSLRRLVQEKDSIYNRFRKDVALIRNIVNYTKIDVLRLSFSETKDSKERKGKLSRTIKNGKWKYTKLSFKMSHPNLDLSEMGKFAFRIYDLDNKMPVALRDKNPVESGMKDEFIYFEDDGSDYIELIHTNHQYKFAENYEAQFYYIGNDGEFKLNHGNFPIISRGRIIKYENEG